MVDDGDAGVSTVAACWESVVTVLAPIVDEVSPVYTSGGEGAHCCHSAGTFINFVPMFAHPSIYLVMKPANGHFSPLLPDLLGIRLPTLSRACHSARIIYARSREICVMSQIISLAANARKVIGCAGERLWVLISYGVGFALAVGRNLCSQRPKDF